MHPTRTPLGKLVARSGGPSTTVVAATAAGTIASVPATSAVTPAATRR